MAMGLAWPPLNVNLTLVTWFSDGRANSAGIMGTVGAGRGPCGPRGAVRRATSSGLSCGIVGVGAVGGAAGALGVVGGARKFTDTGGEVAVRPVTGSRTRAIMVRGPT